MPLSPAPTDDAEPRQPAKPENPVMPPPPAEPITQDRSPARSWVPLWLRQFPVFRFQPFEPTFQLLNAAQLDKILAKSDPAARAKVKRDVEYLEHEVLRLFRERDYEASFHQNRYRLFQLAYMVLALAATIVGSMLALSLESAPHLTPILGAIEAIIAGFTTFFATLSTDEPPQQLWLQNRLRAEFLRREYFRYLMNLAPYSDLSEFDREQELAYRAANINRGVFPEPQTPTV